MVAWIIGTITTVNSSSERSVITPWGNLGNKLTLVFLQWKQVYIILSGIIVTPLIEVIPWKSPPDLKGEPVSLFLL